MINSAVTEDKQTVRIGAERVFLWCMELGSLLVNPTLGGLIRDGHVCLCVCVCVFAILLHKF